MSGPNRNRPASSLFELYRQGVFIYSIQRVVITEFQGVIDDTLFENFGDNGCHLQHKGVITFQ